MIISNGTVTKNLKLYLPAESSPSKKSLPYQKPLPVEDPEPGNEDVRTVLTIGHALQLKIETEDDAINAFINDSSSVSNSTQHISESAMSCEI